MSFSFESYRNLKRYLGESDALIELNELSIRKFIQLANDSGDKDNFVSENSTQLGVRVNISNFDSLSLKMARSYICIVYEATEFFLKDFKKEYESLYNIQIRAKRDDENWLNFTLDYLKLDFDDYIVETISYYKLVRDKVNHQFSVKNEKIERYYKNSLKHQNEIKQNFNNLNAPNPFDKVAFDDFILFSRLLKKIALSICQAVTPNTNSLKQNLDLKKFNKIANNKNRYRNAIIGELRAKYGFDIKEASLIANEIIMAH